MRMNYFFSLLLGSLLFFFSSSMNAQLHFKVGAKQLWFPNEIHEQLFQEYYVQNNLPEIRKGLQGPNALLGLDFCIHWNSDRFGAGLSMGYGVKRDRLVAGFGSDLFERSFNYSSFSGALDLEALLGTVSITNSIGLRAWNYRTKFTGVEDFYTAANINQWYDEVGILFNLGGREYTSLAIGPVVYFPLNGLDLTDLANDLQVSPPSGQEEGIGYGFRLLIINGYNPY